jgi:vacuolar protein sorting-associated protein 3
VYQLLGFQQFRETLFEDAGNNLFNGQIDPRLLVSYFPHLRGGLFSNEDSVDVFSGVAERMPTEASIDEIGAHLSFTSVPFASVCPMSILNATLI